MHVLISSCAFSGGETLVMRFFVYDDDHTSSDDFMGMAYLPMGMGMDGMLFTCKSILRFRY